MKTLRSIIISNYYQNYFLNVTLTLYNINSIFIIPENDTFYSIQKIKDKCKLHPIMAQEKKYSLKI